LSNHSEQGCGKVVLRRKFRNSLGEKSDRRVESGPGCLGGTTKGSKPKKQPPTQVRKKTCFHQELDAQRACHGTAVNNHDGRRHLHLGVNTEGEGRKQAAGERLKLRVHISVLLDRGGKATTYLPKEKKAHTAIH